MHAASASKAARAAAPTRTLGQCAWDEHHPFPGRSHEVAQWSVAQPRPVKPSASAPCGKAVPPPASCRRGNHGAAGSIAQHEWPQQAPGQCAFAPDQRPGRRLGRRASIDGKPAPIAESAVMVRVRPVRLAAAAHDGAAPRSPFRRRDGNRASGHQPGRQGRVTYPPSGVDSPMMASRSRAPCSTRSTSIPASRGR